MKNSVEIIQPLSGFMCKLCLTGDIYFANKQFQMHTQYSYIVAALFSTFYLCLKTLVEIQKTGS